MATINFPASPSVNDTYTFADKTWTWDGTVWNLNPQYVSTKYFESTADPATATLLHTLDNPNASGTQVGDYFGNNSDISENYAIVSAIGEDLIYSNAGRAYIYNVNTGELIASIVRNISGTNANDYVGYDVAISDSYALVGAYREDYNGTDSGAVYVYESSTGNYLTFLQPTGAASLSSYAYFGRYMAIYDKYAAISRGNKVVIMDVSLGTYGTTLHYFTSPAGGTFDNFGDALDICNKYVIVGASGVNNNSGKAYIYDRVTGDLLHTLDNPNNYSPTDDDKFGVTAAISDSYAIVGAGQEDTVNRASAGVLYVFNSQTGELLHTVVNPDTTNSSSFANSEIAISGNYAAIGSKLANSTTGDYSAGVVYLLDCATGEIKLTIDNPNYYGDFTDYFGQSLGMTDSRIIVGANYEDAPDGSSNSGKAYIFDYTQEIITNNITGIVNAQSITQNGTSVALESTSVPQTSSTGAAQLPAGTEAQKPTVPVAGQVRFNTSISSVETYNGTSWTLLDKNSIQAVADGNIRVGEKLVLNTDGTVSPAGALSVLTDPIYAPGTEQTISTTHQILPGIFAASFSPNVNSRFVIAWENSSNEILAAIGTISGDNISYSTPITVVTGANVGSVDIKFNYGETNGTGLITWADDSSGTYNVYAAIFTASSSIDLSVSSPTVVYTGTSVNYNTCVDIDPINGTKFIVGYSASNSSSNYKITYGTIAGSTLSVVATRTVASVYAPFGYVIFDPTVPDLVIAAYSNDSQYYPGVVAYTLGPTSIDVVKGIIFQGSIGKVRYPRLAANPFVAKQYVFVYQDRDGDASGKAILLNLDIDTPIFTASDPVDFTNGEDVRSVSVYFDPHNEGVFTVNYVKAGGEGPYSRAGAISNDTVVFSETEYSFTPDVVSDEGALIYTLFDNVTPDKFATVWSNTYYQLSSFVGESGSLDTYAQNLTETNFIGISAGEYVDGETVTVQLSGSIDTNQKGLTTGAPHYLQLDGTLATTPDSIPIYVGTATSSTNIAVGPPPYDVNEGPVFKATAASNIVPGDTLIVKSDGKLDLAGSREVVLSAIAATTEQVNSTSTSNKPKVEFDPFVPGRFVAIYDRNYDVYMAIGRVGSDGSVTFTYTNLLVSSNTNYGVDVLFDPFTVNRILVNWVSDTYYSYLKVGTFPSDTNDALTFGPSYSRSSQLYSTIAFSKRTPNTFVRMYTSSSDGSGYVHQCTLSGTSISVGSGYQFSGNSPSKLSISANPDTTTSGDEYILGYTEYQRIGKLKWCSIAANTAITYGTALQLESGNDVVSMYAAYHPTEANKIMAAYGYYDGSNTYVKVTSFDVSSGSGTITLQTSGSYATPAKSGFENSLSAYHSVALSPVGPQLIIAWGWPGDATVSVVPVTITNHSISVGSAVVAASTTSDPYQIAVAADPLNPTSYIAFYQTDAIYLSAGRIGATYNTAQNITASNFVGFASKTFLSGATATAQIVGNVNTNQSGLTPGQAYYLQSDGTISTTPDTPSVFVGTAVSATSIIVKG
jgi:hypothetical protein